MCAVISDLELRHQRDIATEEFDMECRVWVFPHSVFTRPLQLIAVVLADSFVNEYNLI